MKKLALLIALTPIFYLHAQTDEQFAEILERLSKLDNSYSVENPMWRGEHPTKYVFTKISEQIAKAEKQKEELKKLEDLSNEGLTRNNQITKALKILQLKDQLSTIEYKTYLIPLNSEGGFYNSPSFFLPNLSFKTLEDYFKYLQWLPTFTDYLLYNIALMKEGIKEGIVAPKIIIQNTLRLLEPWISNDLSKNPFYAPIKLLPSVIDSENQQQISNELEQVITKNILPAYQQLYTWLENDYMRAAYDKVGVSEIKNGRAYYENRIRHFTTMNITPDSVFDTGMAEVKRIRNLMQQIIDQLGYQGSFADFVQFLRTDSQFYARTPQELLSHAAWLSKKAEGQLPKLFGKLYQLPFTVAPVPEDIAPNYTGGRYSHGSRAQNRAGTYWVNTYALESRPLYTLPSLTLHEAVPGHHLQIIMAAEAELSDFRKNYYISAFGEGWGLYAEYLGEEMGMYETPYELFGRYTYEMWRACRLVVDVGLHYKDWTRDEALTFLSENTALSLHEVKTEIDRYIGWPGQSVSYKMGELMIKQLRSDCELQLGQKFDIQEFHEVILRNGSVTLPVLQEEIQQYLADKKSLE